MTGRTFEVVDDLDAVVAHVGDLRRRLLVLDFDGTMSRIVEDSDAATLVAGARDAIAALLDTPLAVAVLSGRPLEDLADRVGDLPVMLVGGHGAEARGADGTHTGLVDLESLQDTLDAAATKVDELIGDRGGWQIERKPHSIAVHYRRADPGTVDDLLPRIEEVLNSHVDDPPGWNLLDGKSIVELRPEVVNKGAAIRWLTLRHRGRLPLVVGDDVTDEEAFEAATELGGVGVLVEANPRRTAARWRLQDPDRVVTLLRSLPESRRYLELDAVEPPIEEHGLISDSRTAALVAPDGSVDWFCVPRFDSPSVFAAILDQLRGGRWRIRPMSEDLDVQRTYLGESNVLVTRFTRGGDVVMSLTDFLVHSQVDAFDATQTGHTLLRRVEAFAPVEMELEFQPRFDYGRATTRLAESDGHLRATAGTEHLELQADGVRFQITPHDDGNGDVARARLRLEAGDHRWFVLSTRGAERGLHGHLKPPELLDLTLRNWGRWTRQIEFQGPWRDAVVRSALVLKALVYKPTGALVAAPTTSLPETIGGERNWDYRYAWVRDSAYVLECFLRVGCAREANTFIRWLSELADRIGGAPDLRPLYRITGEEDLSEFEFTHLAGYRGSLPVRVGNGAADQRQLDIYAAAMQLSYLTLQLGDEVPAARWWPVIERMVGTVRERWHEPDSGVWEIRAAPRHHTFSRFQCWLAVDRAIRIGQDLGLPAPYDEWRSLCGEIVADVLEHGYDHELGAFVQSYGSKELDASLLLLPLRGFMSPTDHRIRSTVEAIRSELEVADGLLLRYRSDDGLRAREGAFLLCSFWLIELLARMGDLEEAERLFDRLMGMAGPLGLFAEEIDPFTHRHLGNFPLGFTHMGLITAAIALADARRLSGRPSAPTRTRVAV